MGRNLLLPLCALVVPLAAGAQSFTPLGDLAGGGFASYGLGISPDGRVVVGQGESAIGVEAFRWTELGGMVGLGDLPGGIVHSAAHAASEDGSVVVGISFSGSGREAFRWTQATGIVGLGDLAGGAFDSAAYAVSNDGLRIVCGGESASGKEAFVWQGGALIPLGDLAGGIFYSVGFGISGDGNVVTGSSNSGVYEPFRFEIGMSMQGLGTLPPGPDFGVANAASFDGAVVVGWDEYNIFGDSEAFRWTAATGIVGMGYLPNPSPLSSRAHDTSKDGSIIVGVSGSASGQRPFLWDATNGMRDLQALLLALGVDLQGYELLTADGVSGDGTRIVGTSLNPGGNFEAWYVVLPDPTVPTPLPPPQSVPALPTPGGVALVLLVLSTGLAFVRRRTSIDPLAR